MSDTTSEALRNALENMVWQFASRGVKDGRLVLSTGGLSALEGAFHMLGWDNPHPVDDAGNRCEWDQCREWATCGTPTTDGEYKRVCYEHFVQARTPPAAQG